MSLYRVKYTHRADRDLEKLPREIAKFVVSAIQDIKEDPYQFIKKLKASNPTHPVYSLRSGETFVPFSQSMMTS